MPRKKTCSNCIQECAVGKAPCSEWKGESKATRDSWKQARADLKRSVEGKLPKGDCWITTKMPWMTDEGWSDFQKRLSEVEYIERKKGKKKTKSDKSKVPIAISIVK